MQNKKSYFMNAELEKLIDFALADGVITDKEREIIRKKAEKIGEDPDEAEMILDAKLAMKENQKTPPNPPVSLLLKCFFYYVDSKPP